MIFFLVQIIFASGNKSIEEHLTSWEHGYLGCVNFSMRNDGCDYFAVLNQNIRKASESLQNIILGALQLAQKEERIDFLERMNFHQICMEKDNLEFLKNFLIFREFSLDMTKLFREKLTENEHKLMQSRDFLYSEENAEKELVLSLELNEDDIEKEVER